MQYDLAEFLTLRPPDTDMRVTEWHSSDPRRAGCVIETSPWWVSAEERHGANGRLTIGLHDVAESEIRLGWRANEVESLEVLTSHPLLWTYGPHSAIYGNSPLRDPIAAPLAVLLEQHRARVRSGPADAVFPSPHGDYWRALHRFQRCVRRANIARATIHDLRHTFGVHCAQAGVPLPRLQKLMGHASPVMTMRYMKHAPESYFAEDAARVAASLQGATRPQESSASAGQGSPSLRLA